GVRAEPVGAVRVCDLGTGEILRPVLRDHRSDDREHHQQQFEAEAEDQLLVPQAVVEEVAALATDRGGLRLVQNLARKRTHETSSLALLGRIRGRTVLTDSLASSLTRPPRWRSPAAFAGALCL